MDQRRELRRLAHEIIYGLPGALIAIVLVEHFASTAPFWWFVACGCAGAWASSHFADYWRAR